MASCFTGVHVVNCKVSRVYFSVVVLCTFEQLEDSTDLFFPEGKRRKSIAQNIYCVSPQSASVPSVSLKIM